MELRVSNEADELEQNFECSNTDAEQSLLGMIMVNPDVFPRVKNFLQPNDFYALANKWIYAAMLDLYLEETLPELVAVANQLKITKRLEGVGGVAVLADMQIKAAMPCFLEQTCRIIWEHAERRKAKRYLMKHLETLQTGAPALEVSESIRREFLGVGRDRKAMVRPMADLLQEAEEVLTARVDNPGRRGLKLGYPRLDYLLNGIEPGEMVLVGARPSMGKTMLALNFAANVGAQGKRVAFFSLEMSSGALIFRLMSRDSQVHLSKFKNGQIDGEDWKKWYSAIGRMADSPLFIFDAQDKITTLEGIEAKLAELEEVDLIVVDYLGLLRVPEEQQRRFGNKHQLIDEFSKGIKTLLQKLKKPGIILCQLSRANRERQDKRPQLSDLRESGSLEEDADIVMFLHREAYYDKEDTSNFAEVIIAKHRNGELGTAYLTYIPETQTFLEGPETVEYKQHESPKRRNGKTPGGGTYAASYNDGE